MTTTENTHAGNYTWCILNTSPVFRTLILVPDLCCAVFLGYCGAHWEHLIFPWIWSRSSLSCWPIWQRTPVLWRTRKQNSTLGRSLQHSWVPLKTGNNVLIQNILHLPSSASILWNISSEYFVSPGGFSTFMLIISASLSAWSQQCTSIGTFAHTELVVLMEGGTWAEMLSNMLFTFLIGLAYNIKKD